MKRALCLLAGMMASLPVWAAPTICVDTHTVIVDVPQGTVATQAVAFSNIGSDPLTWSLATALEGTNFTKLARSFKINWSTPYALKYDPTRDCLWASYYNTNAVAKLNPATGALVEQKFMGTNAAAPNAIEIENGNLWALNSTSKKFVLFDLNSASTNMTVLKQVNYPSGWSITRAFAVGEGAFFAGLGGNTLSRLNTNTGAIQATVSIADQLGTLVHFGYANDMLCWGVSSAPMNRLRRAFTNGVTHSTITVAPWTNTAVLVYDVSPAATATQLWALTYQHYTGLNERWAHLLDLTHVARLTDDGPRAGTLATLTDQDLSFAFDGVGARIGAYPVKLLFTSNDPNTPTLEKTVIFAVHAPGTNSNPTANAGVDQSKDATGPTTPITLTGSGADPNGDELLYVWDVGGVTTVTGKVATVNLPVGTHPVTLTVSDYRGGEATDTMQVVIHAPKLEIVGDPLILMCPQGSVVTQTFQIANTGDGPLNWTMVSELTGTNVLRQLKSFQVSGRTGWWSVDPTALKYDASNNCLWASQYATNELAKLRITDGAVLSRTNFGAVCARPYAIELAGSNLWVANNTSSNFTCFALSNMAVVATVPQPAGWSGNAAGLGIAGSQWYATRANQASIFQLNPATGAVLSSNVTADTFANDRHFCASGGYLWWGGKQYYPQPNVLRQFDPVTGLLRARLTIEQWDAAATTVRDISPAVTNGHFWALTYNHDGGNEYWAHLFDLTAAMRLQVSAYSGALAAGATNTIQIVYDAQGAAVGQIPLQCVFNVAGATAQVATQSAMVVVHSSSPNNPPVANAGPSRTLRTDLTVPIVLFGSRSTDPDGDPLRYTWWEAGTNIGSGASLPVERGFGTYHFTLTVDDYRGGTNSDTVSITVTNRVLKDWPQWYGPDGSGWVAETNANWLANWPPKVLWRRTGIASGGYSENSSPVIDGDRAYYSGGGGLFCLDLHTGSNLWKQTFDGGNPTPLVDDECIYSGSQGSDFIGCWDKLTGSNRWMVTVFENESGDLDGAGSTWSPAVHGDLLLCKNKALNKHTGAVVWTISTYYRWTLTRTHAWNGRSYLATGYDRSLVDPITGTKKLTNIMGTYGAADGTVFYGPNKTWDVSCLKTLGGGVEEIAGVVPAEAYQQPIVVGDYGYYIKGAHGAGGLIGGVDLAARQQRWFAPRRWGTFIAVADKLLAHDSGEVGILRTGTTNYVEHLPLFRFDPAGANNFTLPAYANQHIIINAAQGLTCLYTGFAAPVVNNGAGAYWNEAANSATLNGEIINTGSNNVPCPVTIYYGRADGGTNALAWEGNLPLGPRGAGNFSANVTPLANSVYFYRCYAANGKGGSWAPESRRFTTYPTGSLLADSSLVLHWTFEQTNGTAVADMSGNGNHATITYGRLTNGVLGNAIRAIPTQYYGMQLQVSTAAPLSQPLGGDYTTSCWLQHATPFATVKDFMWWSVTSDSRGFALGMPDESHISLGGVTAGTVAGTRLDTGRWYHVAFTRTGTNHVLYLDGVPVTGNVAGYADEYRYLGFSLGNDSLLDDVRVYRRAFSAEEVRRLATPGLATSGAAPAPLPIAAGSDDAEESVSNGVVNVSDINLHIVRGPAGDQKVGLRFPHAGIPKGATVTSAAIQFKSRRESAWTNVFFNAGSFSSYGTRDTTNNLPLVSGDGRTITLTNNAWKAMPFNYLVTANTMLEFDFRSTAMGDIHGLGLDAQKLTTQGNRTLALYGTNTISGLITTYRTYSNVAPAWAHFTIPLGTKYTGAMSNLFFANDDKTAPLDGRSEFRDVCLWEKATATQAEPTVVLIRAENADDPVSFSATVSNISARPVTAAAVEWMPASWQTNEAAAAELTPNLAGMVQQVVNRAGWTVTNALAFVISGSGQRIADACEKPGGTGAVLRVSWTLQDDPLGIVSAWAIGNPAEVAVLFNRPVATATANVAGNYQINNGIAVFSATVGRDGQTVKLATSTLSTGPVYRVTVNNVTDLAEPPKVIPANSSYLFQYKPSPVEFVKKDTTTQGSWRGAYGADGQHLQIYNTPARYPAYSTVTAAGNSFYNWNYSGTNDVRALQGNSGTGRTIGAWYGNSTSNLVLDINFTDGQKHQVALYCLDWERTNRCQRIDVRDYATGQLWDSQLLSTNSFTNGVWLVWNMTGRQTFRFTDLYPNRRAVVSAIMFDPPALLAPPAGPGGTWEAWRDSNLAGLPAGQQTMAADPDGDGLPNLLEYAFRLDPQKADAGLAPQSGRWKDPATQLEYLTLTYRQNHDAVDVVFTPEGTGNLPVADWPDGTVELTRVAQTGYDQVTVRDTVAMTAATKRFLRLRVTKP